ncbi:hypothetical protein [Rhizobium grahamii]|uniref:Uncharacterized protein n=1 Tax=Rhizobium grahamii CCGE 502 TaxID=990285 RepID=S3H7D4_9HYPH|nr:hypothetical protein [Rhizobium grahamii]EPE94817.1 hypothetical protein RGCCGE502_29953 [Rhizobium grahamii CCGE 502]
MGEDEPPIGEFPPSDELVDELPDEVDEDDWLRFLLLLLLRLPSNPGGAFVVLQNVPLKRAINVF